MSRFNIFGLVFPAVLFVDQLSKWAIMELVLRSGQSSSLTAWLVSPPERVEPARVELLPFFNLTMVWNEGISFGLFSSNAANYQPYILSALSFGICIALFIWLLKSQGLSLTIAISLIIGGAVGNILDRLRFGAVADFFDFHLLGWHYPAFNIADSAIVLGVAYLVIDAVFLNSSSRQEKESS